MSLFTLKPLNIHVSTNARVTDQLNQLDLILTLKLISDTVYNEYIHLGETIKSKILKEK